jgi:hypothetical protein
MGLTTKPTLPAEHIKLLEKYLVLAPHLVPPDQAASTPTLRHPDLCPANIFVKPDGSISAIIDWQHSAILPLFICAGIPDMLDDLEEDLPVDAPPPKVPQNFDAMDESTRYDAVDRYRRHFRRFGYIALTSKRNLRHFKYSPFLKTMIPLTQSLVRSAASPWSGDIISLRKWLSSIFTHWGDIKGENGEVCPITFSKEELEANAVEEADFLEDQSALDLVKKALRISDEGWVDPEDYERAIAKNAEYQQVAYDNAETEEDKKDILQNWPFQDKDVS